jgi:hypothetical protein
MNTEELRTKIELLVDGLPDSSSGIAGYLHMQGCFGTPRAGTECPLAAYFRKNGIENVGVGHSRVAVLAGSNTAVMVKNPPHVRLFTQDFDNGKYPELIRYHDGVDGE